MHKYGRSPLSGADANSVGQAHRFQPFNPGHKTAFQANKQQQQQPRLKSSSLKKKSVQPTIIHRILPYLIFPIYCIKLFKERILSIHNSQHRQPM